MDQPVRLNISPSVLINTFAPPYGILYNICKIPFNEIREGSRGFLNVNLPYGVERIWYIYPDTGQLSQLILLYQAKPCPPYY